MLRKLVIVTFGLMLVVNIDYSAHAQMTIDLTRRLSCSAPLVIGTDVAISSPYDSVSGRVLLLRSR